MPSISYNLNIPAGPNNPSNDQPLMQTNTNSINTYLNVDHFGFSNSTSNNFAGWHAQVGFPTQFQGVRPSGAGVTASESSVLWTSAGVAAPASNLQFTNNRGTFLLDGVSAFGAFATQNTNNAMTFLTQMNCTSITPSSLGKVYTIQIPTPLIPSASCGVLITMSGPGGSLNTFVSTPSYTFTSSGGAGTLVITLPTIVSGFVSTTISFMVFQA